VSDDNQPVVDQPTPVADAKADDSAKADVTAVGTDQYGRQMYETTCGSCGKKTQVPFKPAGDRPVYCRECYLQRRGGDRRSSGGGGGGGGGGRNWQRSR